MEQPCRELSKPEPQPCECQKKIPARLAFKCQATVCFLGMGLAVGNTLISIAEGTWIGSAGHGLGKWHKGKLPGRSWNSRER